MTVDPQGSVYVTGTTISTGFRTSSGLLHFYSKNPVAYRDATAMEIELWATYCWDHQKRLSEILGRQFSGELPINTPKIVSWYCGSIPMPLSTTAKSHSVFHLSAET